MKKFISGETVVCKCTCRVGGVLYDPGTITTPVTGVLAYIYNSANTAVVDGVASTRESAGVYTYDYQSTTIGKFRFMFKCVDGTKISKKDSSFEIVS